MGLKDTAAEGKQHATGHFRHQRFSALLLVPFSYWLLILFQNALNRPYVDTATWLMSPINAVGVIIWTVLAMYHSALGVKVVLEDYVSTRLVRQIAIRSAQLIFFLMGIAAVAAVSLFFWTR
ncbi:MAG: succinate dehydrogenase, hydrophobic membrane anchor protein [Gammaproteobacteria bacterium]